MSQKAKNIRVPDLREIHLSKVEYKGTFQGIRKAYGRLLKWASTYPQKKNLIAICIPIE